MGIEPLVRVLKDFPLVDLFNNPVGCRGLKSGTSLVDLVGFCKKSTKSTVFQRKLFNN
jgi:hypothetical protein